MANDFSTFPVTTARCATHFASGGITIPLFSSVELLRRQGKNGAKCQTGQQFYVCAEENAKDPANPDNWEWEDQGAYSFNASLETPQAYRMKGTPSVRYIKVYFGEKYKGVGDQAMLAEINVYTVK